MTAGKSDFDDDSPLPSQMSLDIAANRLAKKWTKKELAGRILWRVFEPIFALSPRPLWQWRRWLLRRFGARIGANVQIHPSVKVTIPWNLKIDDYVGIGDRVNLYALGYITIGNRATISQGAHLCAGTHDWRDPALPLIKSPITIGSGAWICADAFIGPDVVIGENTVIGARAVAMKSVAANKVAIGNPLQVVSVRFKR